MPTTTLPLTALDDAKDSELISAPETAQPAGIPTLPPTRSPDDLPPSPTPNSADAAPTIEAQSIQYAVQANDTLGIIADKFDLDWEDLARFNQLNNPNALEIGQILRIPSGQASDFGPDTKLIPDSELPFPP